MKPVLTAAQMREADRRTIEDLEIPGFTLMETAGRAAASEIASRFGFLEELSVCCLCGKGNNGGDALVIARLLADAGADVHVRMALGTDGLSPDSEKNLLILKELSRTDKALSIRIETGPAFEDLGFDVLVDGLLGTGLTSPVRDPVTRLVEDMNGSGIPVVAVDVPTGLNADTGDAMGSCVFADVTVTMGALKQGLLVNDGPTFAGEIVVVDVGIPKFALEGCGTENPTATWLPDEYDVAALLPHRDRRAHKYSAGMVLAVAGSPGLTGAPVMASRAAARVGAGAVVCACPETVQPVLAAKLDEVMTLALPATADGLDPAAREQHLAARLQQASAALIGCGLGRLDGTARFVRDFLSEVSVPVVVDADGLAVLDEDFLEQHAKPSWILTPHRGEFRRIVGEAVAATDPVEVARSYAQRWNCTVILKGAPSVVDCPDGTAYISAAGNQALASAGTGDVLAGMCAGYLAQGLPAADAAVAALFVGGRAVEVYADRYHRDSLLAGDIVDLLPEVLAELTL